MRQDSQPTTTLFVADLMTLDPVVVDVNAPLEDAERLMQERRVSGLPVVDRHGALVGVISRTDVLEDGGAAWRPCSAAGRAGCVSAS